MQDDLSRVLGWDLCVTSLYRDRHPVHLLMGSVELDRSTATKMNSRGANWPHTSRLDYETSPFTSCHERLSAI
jgi:hypothetical protein